MNVPVENEGTIWSWMQDNLPDGLVEFLNKDFYYNTTFEWLFALLIILAAVLVAKLAYWVIGRYLKHAASRTKSRLDDILVDKLEEPIIFGIVIIGMWWGFETLHFTDNVQGFIN
ncbi:MAG: hypothetical protein HKN32_05185, partial [Flavobacteriales bacterium]|nr:hypothetical protein [Flavobacteriales bacterium]